MAPVRRLSGLPTAEDFAFIERMDAVASIIDKLREAKRLIDEARAEASPIQRRLGMPAPRAKAPKKEKTRRKSPEINFGVDVPAELSPPENSVLNVLDKGLANWTALHRETELTVWRLANALKRLHQRGLIKPTGTGKARFWKKA